MSLSFIKLAAVKAANALQDRPRCPLHVLLIPITPLFIISPQKAQTRQVNRLDASLRA